MSLSAHFIRFNCFQDRIDYIKKTSKDETDMIKIYIVARLHMLLGESYLKTVVPYSIPDSHNFISPLLLPLISKYVSSTTNIM